MPCRGIRGATAVETDDDDTILTATRELLTRIVEANDMAIHDIASAFFTVTPDLTTAFPAQVALELGWQHVALLDAQEITVSGSLPRCVRVLIHWNTDKPQAEICHVYLRGAVSLRQDPGNKEERAMISVAFQGERGAYSEEAIYQFFDSGVETQPCQSFEDIFEAVRSGAADYGALPVENSTAGSINQAYDLLLDHDLRIWGEIILRVQHALLAPSGTTLADIQRARSHPQALAQCKRYLSNHDWTPETAYDTAGSARDLAAAPEPGVAAIASRLAGQLYSLEELDYGIEDLPHNYTRFFILSHQDPARAERNKTSIVFSTRHRPGALHACLGEFASRGINLTKIESRPRRDRPWHYVFYLDFEGHWQDPPCTEALTSLLLKASFVKVLGSYPAATMPDQ